VRGLNDVQDIADSLKDSAGMLLIIIITGVFDFQSVAVEPLGQSVSQPALSCMTNCEISTNVTADIWP